MTALSKKALANQEQPSYWKLVKKNITQYYELYLLIIPIIAFYIVFYYAPMYGAQIAFRRFRPRNGIWGSQWVGMLHFINYFKSYYFWRLIRNTFLLNIYGIIFHFPMPIFLALLINEVKHGKYKRVVQTVTYLPHFVSVVVICALLIDMLEIGGWLNTLIEQLGGTQHSFMTDPGAFRTIFVASNVYQHIGWNSIVYLAAISAIDPQLYEAARIDGTARRREPLPDVRQNYAALHRADDHCSVHPAPGLDDEHRA